MAYANVVLSECLGNGGGEFGQLDALSAIGGRFSRLRRDLLNGVFRLVKIEKSAESLRFLQRVNVAALQVFDKLRLQCLSVGKVDDTDGHGFRLGKLGGAVASGSGDNLEAALGQWPHKQGRENALAADACGQFIEG